MVTTLPFCIFPNFFNEYELAYSVNVFGTIKSMYTPE